MTHTDQNDTWDELYDRIRLIAMRRSETLLIETAAGSDETDRGARSLRALMGAAEIARRMKCEDEKEESLNDQAPQPPDYTDEDIRRIYEDVAARVERLADEDERADRGDDEARARVGDGAGSHRPASGGATGQKLDECGP